MVLSRTISIGLSWVGWPELMARRGEIGPLSASIDRLVRARIAEFLRAAGVDQGRIGVEVLFELPPSFVRAYEELWRIALGQEGHDGQGRAGGGGGGQRQGGGWGRGGSKKKR